MCEKFTLAWNDHAKNAKIAFQDLFADEHFTDVTLVCDDGTKIDAHKVVLSSTSPFFRYILLLNTHAHIFIYLKGVKYRDMLAVLKFVYLGETSVEQNHLKDFLELTKELKIDGLSDEIHTSSYIKQENYQNEENTENIETQKVDENKEKEDNGETVNGEENTNINYNKDAAVNDYNSGNEDNEERKDTEAIEHFGDDGNSNFVEENEEMPVFQENVEKNLNDIEFADNLEFLSNMEQEETSLNIDEKQDILDKVLNDTDHTKLEKVNKYVCIECGMSFSRKDSKDIHMSSVHKGEKYKCNNCSNVYKGFSALRNHQRVKHEGQTLECEICKKQLLSFSGLRNHKEIFHASSCYNCPQCEQVCTALSSLKSHIRSKHQGKTYDCDECQQTFTSSSAFKRHKESVHEGVRYPCNVCEYKAKQKSHLKTHMVSHHSNSPEAKDSKGLQGDHGNISLASQESFGQWRGESFQHRRR